VRGEQNGTKYRYRVVWRREGREWTDHNGNARVDKPGRYVQEFATLKSAERHRLVLLGRGSEVWGTNDDEALCADGCRTRAEHVDREFASKGIRPLLGEPVIERREVGPWQSQGQREVTG
jgi:hypothetical protein